MTHRIRHQILDLELPREAGAAALQRRASRVFQEQVLPRLDEVFSRIAPAGRVLRIDQLNLDLGELAEINWERDFIEKCVEQITLQITDAAFNLESVHNATTIGLDEQRLEVFLYFLETGTLPWHAKGLSLKALEESLLEKLEKQPTISPRNLRQLIQEEPDSLKRLVWQFSEAFATQVLERMLGLSTDWLKHAIRMQLQQQSGVSRQFVLISIVQYLMKTPLPAASKMQPEPALMAKIFALGAPAPSERKSQTQSRDEQAANQSASPEDAHSGPEPSTAVKAPRTENAQKASKKSVRPSLPGTPIEYAGLVLLSVYLPPFFKRLNIELPIGNDLPTQGHYRAVHLLHYLATGVLQPEEPLLALPKILCGMNLEAAVPADIELSEKEKEEANRLLEAVIRNWPVLKNTSPDGLRVTFLQRAGLLSYSETRGSWVLQVERQGQDLLLEKVPWSYSVIKLPWMPEMLGVEW